MEEKDLLFKWDGKEVVPGVYMHMAIQGFEAGVAMLVGYEEVNPNDYNWRVATDFSKIDTPDKSMMLAAGVEDSEVKAKHSAERWYMENTIELCKLSLTATGILMSMRRLSRTESDSVEEAKQELRDLIGIEKAKELEQAIEAMFKGKDDKK